MRVRENKLKFLAATKFVDLDFEHIIPDKRHNWLNLTDNDFDELLPLIDKDVKSGKSQEAVFKLFSSGIKTQRDEWVYGFSQDALVEKVKYLIEVYQQTFKDENYSGRMTIKWDAELTRYLERKIYKSFDEEKIFRSLYRPYVKQFFYFDQHFNGRTYQWFSIFSQLELENKYIVIPGISSPKDFHILATKTIIDLNCLPAGSQCLPFYYYDENGNCHENITDWSLQKFQSHYNNKKIKKIDIFYYTYAVLHHPTYRQKYEQNLKREFPRLPFYENFQQWVKWGKKLIDLHINYEIIKPFPLTRIDLPTPDNSPTPKPKLKADKTKDKIFIDTITTLEKIPKIAWEYRLGNRSALEWVLDQYKEKKPRDKTIAEKFNTYRFADYKETVIDLLKKVSTVRDCL